MSDNQLIRKPTAVSREVCDTCGIDWFKHMGVANKRVLREIAKSSPGTGAAMSQAEVKIEDCIYLLQHVNEGPVGPIGVSGEAGECSCSNVLA